MGLVESSGASNMVVGSTLTVTRNNLGTYTLTVPGLDPGCLQSRFIKAVPSAATAGTIATPNQTSSITCATGDSSTSSLSETLPERSSTAPSPSSCSGPAPTAASPSGDRWREQGGRSGDERGAADRPARRDGPRRASIATAPRWWSPRPGAGKTTRVPPALVDRGPRHRAAAAPRRRARRGPRASPRSAAGRWAARSAGTSASSAASPPTRGCWSPPRASSPRACSTTRCCRRAHGGARRVPRAQPARRPRAGARRARPGWRAPRPAPGGDVGDARRRAGGALPRRLPRRRACPGAAHPLAIEYAPGRGGARRGARTCCRAPRGQVLCFLPGAARDRAARRRRWRVTPPLERRRGACRCTAASTARRRTRRCGRGARPAARDPGHQHRRDVAHRARRRRRWSTPGWRRWRATTRRAASTGSDLSASPPTSADQRAGRAARLGPGLVRRLWDARDRLRASREPDIARVDLAGAAARRAGLGRRSARRSSGSRRRRPTRSTPPLALLRAAGRRGRRGERARSRRSAASCSGCRCTCGSPASWSRRGGAPNVAAACALLGEGRRPRPGRRPRRRATCSPTSTASPRSRRTCGRWRDELGRLARAALDGAGDRAGVARTACGGRCSPASPIAWPGAGPAPPTGCCWPRARRGAGARIGVRDGEFLVALDVRGADARGVAEARIHLASRVEPEWITPTAHRRRARARRRPRGRVRRAARGARRRAGAERDAGAPPIPEAAAARAGRGLARARAG